MVDVPLSLVTLDLCTSYILDIADDALSGHGVITFAFERDVSKIYLTTNELMNLSYFTRRSMMLGKIWALSLGIH